MVNKVSNKVNTKNIVGKKKVCAFCENGKQPSFTDSAFLRKFMNDRSRIVARQRTGVCSKHQRKVSKEIKYARHLALLPFITQV